MAVPGTLPFQYALRGANVLNDPISAQDVSQRDRDLEDYLNALSQWVGYVPGGAGGGAYWYGNFPAATSLPANVVTLVPMSAPSAAVGFTLVGGQARCDVAGTYLVNLCLTTRDTVGNYMQAEVRQTRAGTTIRGSTSLAAMTTFWAQVVVTSIHNLQVGDLIGVYANGDATRTTDFRNEITIIPVGGAKGDTGPAGPAGAGALLGYAESTTVQNGITTATVDLTGLSITFTLTAQRRVELTAYGWFFKAAADTTGVAFMQIADSANVEKVGGGAYIQASSYVSIPLTRVLTLAAGTYTFKCRASTNAGFLNTTANANEPVSLRAVDVGP